MDDKKQARLRRSTRTRVKIKELKVMRLSVHRSNQHIYAQIVDSTLGKIVASASSVECEVRGSLANGGNKAAASVVGKRIAEKARAIGVEVVAFDRSGFRYHGRVKALADAAREAGLAF
ncbi:MAG TPA: 50S ribosomal protein L18 [Burkholderiales bacterium]|nr:50S ribosomal protein L18 [Burkholderiales bacterium]